MPNPRSTADHILILVGTVTGNAELVAGAISDALSHSGYSAHTMDMMDAVPETLRQYSHVIICTSSWGDGEIPDNAIDLYEGLSALSIDLSHVRFGVIGLGDRIYHTDFCGGAIRFDRLFRRLGATRVLDRHEIDAGPTKVDLQEASQWSLRWAAACTVRSSRSTAA